MSPAKLTFHHKKRKKRNYLGILEVALQKNKMPYASIMKKAAKSMMTDESVPTISLIARFNDLSNGSRRQIL